MVASRADLKPHVAALRLPLLWAALFLIVTTALSWPLPRHLSTHLTGPPSGDTGVYVWNLWVFHHQLVVQHSTPLQTGTVMSLAPPVDLTLHNYTIFVNLLAVPLLQVLPLLTTFNLLYLGMMALTAWCTALLARRAGAGNWEAWLAGVAFAWSPVLVARSTAHFSMLAAAPLPLLLYWMVRGQGTGQLRYAVAIGATLAWAVFCDVYYAVYGALLVLGWTAASTIVVARGHSRERRRAWLTLAVDGLIVIVAAFVTAIAVQGGLIEIAGIRISMRTLYTPMLLLTALVAARLLLAWRPRFILQVRPTWATAGLVLAGVVTMAAGMGPVLLAFGSRLLEGSLENPGIHWRSSPPGVDLLALVMPNPNHPLFGKPFHDWLVARRPDGFAELTGSMSLVALATIVVGWRATGWRPKRRWVWMPLVFAALALGPFVTVAGVNTHVPGPWALLRYLPIIGLARSPSRFAVVVSLLVAVLFGLALTAIGRRWPASRRVVLAAVTVALLFELSPAPRTLYGGTPPAVVSQVAADPRPDIRVLMLPFGLRDGTSSLGNFDPLTQYYQTIHGKRLIGGYLSRLTTQQKAFHLTFPVLHALIALSEQTPLSPAQREKALASGDRFVERARLGFVMVDDRKATPALRAFAMELFRLQHVSSADGYSLYVPGAATAVVAPETALSSQPLLTDENRSGPPASRPAQR